MREQIKSVFTCEFCDKHLFVKHAMVRHESNCNGNPKNQSACSACVYCEETKKDYVVDGDYGEEARRTNGFKCTKLNLLMYPFKVVRKGVLTKYPDMFIGEVQMPTKCDHWNYVKE